MLLLLQRLLPQLHHHRRFHRCRSHRRRSRRCRSRRSHRRGRGRSRRRNAETRRDGAVSMLTVVCMLEVQCTSLPHACVRA